MKCRNCDTINEEDAIYCKKCGLSLIEEKIDNKEEKVKKDKKVKKKVKTKTKVKKVKEKSKDNKDKKGMTLFQKIIMFIMFLLIVILLGVVAVFGYSYYQENNVLVPDVINMDYDSAVLKMVEVGLRVEKVEVNTEEQSDVGIVLKQSKKANTKVLKNSKVKLSVGVLDLYTMPNFKGKNIDEVTNTLNHENIKYKIEYQEITSGEDSVVLIQTPSAKSTIKKTDIVTLVVTKLIEEKEEEITDNTTNDEQSTEEDLEEEK